MQSKQKLIGTGDYLRQNANNPKQSQCLREVIFVNLVWALKPEFIMFQIHKNRAFIPNSLALISLEAGGSLSTSSFSKGTQAWLIILFNAS